MHTISHLGIHFQIFQALEICNDTVDTAAYYHLARQLENKDHEMLAIEQTLMRLVCRSSLIGVYTIC